MYINSIVSSPDGLFLGCDNACLMHLLVYNVHETGSLLEYAISGCDLFFGMFINFSHPST